MSALSWLHSEEFSPLDRHFAEFIYQQSQQSELPTLAAALVSRARRHGHVCLDVGELPLQLMELETVAGRFGPLAPEDFNRALAGSTVVGNPGDFRPLILAGPRLYLHRYWEYETRLAEGLRRLAAGRNSFFNPGMAGEILRRYFPESTETSWQKVAAFAGLRNQLTILTGGPGTGKTYTLVFLLAALQQMSVRPLQIALCAPTGKAAGRMQESISQLQLRHPALEGMNLPGEASTIHRLLGSRPRSVFFRHDSTHPLTADLVVVDEASMIDLALFAKLVDALPPQALLIVAGDRNQLASVEAGSIFADLLEGVAPNRFSADFQRDWAESSGAALSSTSDTSAAHVLKDCVVELERNFRFANDSGIARASRLLRKGLPLAEELLLTQTSDLRFIEPASLQELKRLLREPVLKQFDQVIQAPDQLEALNRLNRFRILCALRHGPWGVAGLNQLVEEILAEGGRIRRSDRYYPGRPILVTQNDYNLNLFNGDVGLVLPSGREQEVAIYFPNPEGGSRTFSAARLPAHETVHAMTIHKSQGSEWDEIAIVLPREESPVLTRELLYTALTRARKQVMLFSTRGVLTQAWGRPTRRHSGLPEALLLPDGSTASTSR